MLANDTIIGDPLFSVPFLLPSEDQPPEYTAAAYMAGLSQAATSSPQLCFQIHGEPDTHFNLISDTCTSVNARYSRVGSSGPPGVHVLSWIGVSAVNLVGECVFVELGLDSGCVPVVRGGDNPGPDAVELGVGGRYSQEGVSVMMRRTHVRISVPNCGQQRLIMYVTCETEGDQSRIRFDITRGINLSPTSHGLLGKHYVGANES